VQNVQIYTKYCTKSLGGRAPPGPAEGAYNAPPTSYSWIKGEGREGEGRGREKEWMRRKGKEGRERKERGGEGRERRTLSPSYQIFWLRS